MVLVELSVRRATRGRGHLPVRGYIRVLKKKQVPERSRRDRVTRRAMFRYVWHDINLLVVIKTF